MNINILLNNGDVIKTKEVYIDEIFNVLRKCGKPCKHIVGSRSNVLITSNSTGT